MKIYIAHSSGFDYESELYVPIRTSSLNTEHDIFLPHESEGFIDTEKTIKNYDILIAEVSFPSTGEGIEIGRAEAAGIPIACIYKEGLTPSSSLESVAGTIVPYRDTAEMIRKIQGILQALQEKPK